MAEKPSSPTIFWPKLEKAKRTVKSVKESSVSMRQLVMPQHANPYNTVFGGVIMSWIDMAAAMVAERHTRSEVVTVHIENISFKSKIKVGDHVLIDASINYVGETSMLIGVKVQAENPHLGTSVHSTTAYLTFVALGDDGKPSLIPDIKAESDSEKRRYARAKDLIDTRKKV